MEERNRRPRPSHNFSGSEAHRAGRGALSAAKKADEVGAKPGPHRQTPPRPEVWRGDGVVGDWHTD